MVNARFRFLVSTLKLDFYNLVRDSISKENNVELIMNVGIFKDISNKLATDKANILLLDLDANTPDPQYLQSLTSKFNILIILTGTNNVSAIPLIRGEIKYFIPKPISLSSFSAVNYTNSLLSKIKMFTITSNTLNPVNMGVGVTENQKIIAIASSTGGTEALDKIFRALPQETPPILVVQHMPSGFTKLFADRLNSLCKVSVKEAKSNDYLQKGQVLIAPADSHMKLVKIAGKLAVECFVGVKVHGVMPAADILFESIPPIMRNNVVGVVLTGMGSDGAKGLLKMHISGAKTICQDEESSVVYGMPKVAYNLGAVDFQLPLDQIAEKIMELSR